MSFCYCREYKLPSIQPGTSRSRICVLSELLEADEGLRRPAERCCILRRKHNFPSARRTFRTWSHLRDTRSIVQVIARELSVNFSVGCC
jgi:hypothetical protein